MSKDTTLDVFEVDLDEIGSLPSFEPFVSGNATGLSVSAEVKTVGSTEQKNKWQFLEVKFTMEKASTYDLISDSDEAPKEGDTTVIQYDIIRTNKDDGKEYNCSVKHVTPKGKEAAGSFAGLMKDWECLERETPKEIASLLLEGLDSVDATFIRKESTQVDNAGMPYVNQFVRNIDLS